MTLLKNLNTRERTLAFLLIGVAFVLLNLLFLPKLTAANRENKTKNTDLKAQLTAAQSWMSKKDYWTTRKQWLLENEPGLGEARQDSLAQLEQLQKLAKKCGLTISDIQLLQLPETPFYSPVGAKVSLNGPWSGLVELMAELQTPTLFDVVPQFSIKSGDEPSSVLCEMEIQRWFQKSMTP
jgi:hypothetical protein